jgi:hypothetical protein
MRRIMVLTGATLLITTGALAYAATGYHFSAGHIEVNHVAYMWRGSIGSADNTTDDAWVRFPMVPPGLAHHVPQVVTISTIGPVTATLSVNVNGAPATFRVVEDGHALWPGVAHFAGRPGDTSRSFTFVSEPNTKTGCHHLQVEWRSASGDVVTATNAALVIGYNRPSSGAC